MKKSTRFWLVVFALISVADVLLLALGNETVPCYIKPFLIPSLTLAAMCELLPERRGPLTWALLTALVFHTAGDILLLFDGKGFIFFALGLGAFLLGHWCYLRIISSGLSDGGRGWKDALCISVPVAVTPIVVILLGVSGAMRYAIAVYGLTLLLLVSFGILRAMKGKPFAWRIIAGGLLFIISDALIAVNVFRDVNFALRHALVLGTYLPAEYLLVSGMVRGIIPPAAGEGK